VIQRISGGNSGIASYLRTGIKQGRDYSRAEMDRRYTLQGDLDLTDKIINSIHDKGQERYLHITLSFYENDISVEKVNEVVKEYKELLMSAYDESEYNFYAELHHPILKNYTDNSTGALVERKPHVHIVIPEKNLITGKHLNPRGRGEFNIEQLDSIQEHINKKYDLKSPKDCIRVSDQNHANVLARSKGDLFKELEGEFKLNLIKSLDEKNIKTVEDFKKHLETFGEVRTYNAGKKNEYLGVNLGKSGKFTRLKSPLFSKEYITNRSIPLLKKSEDRIKKDLDNWKNINSLEIKLINTASQKIRQSYAKLSYEDKLVALKKIEEQYNEKNGITKLSSNVRRTNPVRSLEVDSRGNARVATNNRQKIGLPHMSAGGMVYGLERRSGHRATNQSTSILSSVQSGNMAEVRRTINSNSPVRRTQSDKRTSGIDSQIDTLSTKVSIPTSEESKQMKSIRDSLNPDRFLSYCQKRFNIDPTEHKVTLKSGGSPRFAVGSRNLNASDFLTKHIGLDWKEAKNALLELQKNQQEQKYYVPVLDRQPLTREEAKERFESLTSSIKKLNNELKEEFRSLNSSFRNELKNCYTIKNKEEREAQKTLTKFYFERDKENLNLKFSDLRREAKQIHNNWISKTRTLKNISNTNQFKEIGVISSANNEGSISEKMKKHRQFEEFKTEYNKKLTDLIASKKGGEVHYTHKETGQTTFIDMGKDLKCASTDKENLAIMLGYAEKKFGGKLKLSGSNDFKEKIAQVVAEKELNIILTPEKYQKLMLEHAQKIKNSQIDNTIEKSTELEQKQVDTKETDIAEPTKENQLKPRVNYYVNDNEFSERNISSLLYTIILSDNLKKDAMFFDAKIDIKHGENETNLSITGFENNDLAIKCFNDVSNEALEEISMMNEKDLDCDFDR